MVSLQIISKILATKDLSIIENNLLTEDYFVGYEQEYQFLIQHKKEYGSGVFNGETGTILNVNNQEKIIEVQFDDDKICWYEFSELDQIEHSYSITIHKAQRK